MSPKLTIKAVTSVKQKDPASFEVRTRLRTGSPAVIVLSASALAELVQHVEPLFQGTGGREFRPDAGPDSSLD
jgi:hypothetical protein